MKPNASIRKSRFLATEDDDSWSNWKSGRESVRLRGSKLLERFAHLLQRAVYVRPIDSNHIPRRPPSLEHARDRKPREDADQRRPTCRRDVLARRVVSDIERRAGYDRRKPRERSVPGRSPRARPLHRPRD